MNTIRSAGVSAYISASTLSPADSGGGAGRATDAGGGAGAAGAAGAGWIVGVPMRGAGGAAGGRAPGFTTGAASARVSAGDGAGFSTATSVFGRGSSFTSGRGLAGGGA